jgi:hypothetical protein
LIFIGEDVGLSPKPVWTLSIGEKYLASAGNQIQLIVYIQYGLNYPGSCTVKYKYQEFSWEYMAAGA